MSAPLTWELSSKTPLIRKTGKLTFSCETCGAFFEKHACHAKRTKSHFCSHSCASKAKEVKAKGNCCVCGATFLAIPSNLIGNGIRNAKKVTCSNSCAAKKKQYFLNNDFKNLKDSKIYNHGKFKRGVALGLVAKISERDVRKIRLDPRSQRAIAEEYGVTQSNISAIKARKTWSHVSERDLEPVAPGGAQ